WDRLQHESTGRLLGQRADGELLRLLEEGAGPRRGLRYPRFCPGGHLRVHRGLLQWPTPALLAGVRLPSGVRAIRITLNFVSTFRGELQHAVAGEDCRIVGQQRGATSRN